MNEVQIIEIKAAKLKVMEKKKVITKKESQNMKMKEKITISSNTGTRKNLKKCNLEINKVQENRITIWSLMNK